MPLPYHPIQASVAYYFHKQRWGQLSVGPLYMPTRMGRKGVWVWVCSFLTAYQHKKGYLVPFKVYTIDENENNMKVKPMNVRSRLLS